MSESKHTPGLWVATVQDVYSEVVPEDGGNIVCEAPEEWEDSMRRWEANARLIAAAPDLLEACEAFLAAVLPEQKHWDLIKAAVAKAKREE